MILEEVFKWVPSKTVVMLLSMRLMKIVKAAKKVLEDIKRISWMVE